MTLAHDFHLCRAHIVVYVMLGNVVCGASSPSTWWCWRSSLSQKRSGGAVSSALRQVQKIRSFRHKGLHACELKWMKRNPHSAAWIWCGWLCDDEGEAIVISSRTMMSHKQRRDSIINQSSIKLFNQNHLWGMPPTHQHSFSVASSSRRNNNNAVQMTRRFNSSENMVLESSSESCRQRWR